MRHVFIIVCLGLAACPSPPDDSPEVDIEGTSAEPDTEVDAFEVVPDVPPDIEVTASECVPGVDIACDDGNPCTDDVCRPSGSCAHTPNIALCDDGDACTTFDRCVGGVCVGSAFDCDDGEPCTDDVCTDGGCENRPRTGECDDQDACTEGDTCLEGACVGAAITCPSGPCSVGSCEPRTGCVAVAIAEGEACDDGDACTHDTSCVDGRCRGDLLSCDDGDPCSDDYCDPVLGCVARPNRAACDDGDRCTLGDRCAEGVCAGVAVAVCCADDGACDDGDACTDDTCRGECVHSPRVCDDGDACTRDVCEAGQCVSAPWSAVAAEGQLVDDFEVGLGAWTITSTNEQVTWRDDDAWAASGDKSLHCGGAAGAGYDFGVTRASASRRLLVPSGDPELHFVVNMAVASESCIYDALTVRVDGAEVGVVCGPGEREEAFSLAAFEGREVELELVFDTVDDIDNVGLGVFVDRLRVTASGCQ